MIAFTGFGGLRCGCCPPADSHGRRSGTGLRLTAAAYGCGRFCTQLPGNTVPACTEESANLLAHWTRSEPTTAAIAERSAVECRWPSPAGVRAPAHRQRAGSGTETEIVVGERQHARRHADLARCEASRARSTAWSCSGVPTDIYSHPHAGQARARQPRHAGAGAVAGREMDGVGRQPTYTLTLRDGRRPGPTARRSPRPTSLFTFQAIYDPKVGSVLASSLLVNGAAAQGHGARRAHGGRHAIRRRSVPGIRLLDNLTWCRSTSCRRRSTPARSRRPGAPATPPTRPGVDRPVRADPLRAGPAAGLRPQSALLEEGRGRRRPCRISIRSSSRSCRIRTPSWCACSRAQIDMLQQQVRPEDIATLRPLVDQKKLQLLELGVGTDPDVVLLQPAAGEVGQGSARRAGCTRKEFRQAISHAVDREAFANTVFLGAGVPIWGPVTPGQQALVLAQRAALPVLARAAPGRCWPGSASPIATPTNGSRTPRAPRRASRVLTYRGNTSLERVAAVLRDDLKPLGIAVDVSALEQGALVERMLKGDFEPIFFVYSATRPRSGACRSISGSARAPRTSGTSARQTPATDWEREIDQLMPKQAATSTTPSGSSSSTRCSRSSPSTCRRCTSWRRASTWA